MKTIEELYDESAFKANNPNLPDHDKRDVIFLLNQCVSQFQPSPKDRFQKWLEERISSWKASDRPMHPFNECKLILSEYIKQVPVSSPKEISEEEIEGLFLAKYGNKITASDSWVIRFALECVRKFSLPSSGTDISK